MEKGLIPVPASSGFFVGLRGARLNEILEQTSTSGVGPAGKAAEGLCSRQSGAVGSRCRLCSDARMYQTITSDLMAGSAGEATEGVVQPANAGASLGAQAVRDGRL